jgi:hypothetical protein
MLAISRGIRTGVRRAVAMALAGMLGAGASVAAQNRLSPYLLLQQALERDRQDLDTQKKLAVDRVSISEDLNDTTNLPKGPPEPSEGDRDYDTSLRECLALDRYALDYVGMSDLDDRPMFLVRFTPKPSNDQLPPPEHATLEQQMVVKVLNNLVGEIYIDQATHGVARFEGHLPRDHTQHLFLIAEVFSADVTYEQALVQNAWLPRRIVVTIRYTKTLGLVVSTERHVTLYTNYRSPSFTAGPGRDAQRTTSIR